MALSFNKQKGKAQKGANRFKFQDGDNKFRIVGDILPRYVYWVNTGNGNVPMECLSFDRELEAFTNVEKDYVQEYFPDLRCGWSYVCQVIDLSDGKLKLMDLKKKMWEQICTAAEDLGDPTDPDEGWDCVVKRAKTGSAAYNVEYTLKVLACKQRALTEEERATIAEMKPIDELVPRPTPEKQKEQLDKAHGDETDDTPEDESVDSEFDIE